MKRFTLALLLLLVTSPVYADWDEKEVAKIVEQIKAGKGFIQNGEYENGQQVIVMTSGLRYVIDVRAKLCFVHNKFDAGLVLIPCKAIKDGYPLFAPIITWEK